jgi:putative acetyltransferase
MQEELPNHHSAVRSLTAKSAGREYRAVRSLAEAQAEKDFAVILEGDFGGQIYLTCPVERIKCTEQTLRQLLFDIDDCVWEDNEACGLYFESAAEGARLAGGMGGAIVAADVWIHPELHALGLAERIVEVVNVKRDRLDAPNAAEMEHLAESPIVIRPEHNGDAPHIRAMHMRAFGEDSPGALVDDLREANLHVISVIAECEGQILGHALFSRLEAPLRALTMAPVAVCPTVQRRGIGSKLIIEGLKRAEQGGWQVVFVLGDPVYYERFGFKAETAAGYTSPYRGPGNMALLLDKDAARSGTITFPPAFDEDIREHHARERL